jgi:putative aminopeptidase FrvX
MEQLLREMLDEFLMTHSPSGQEQEMEEAARPWLEEYCDDVWMDARGNLIGKIRGERPEGAVAILSHKDEIAAVVERIEDDGCVRLEGTAGIQAWRYGEGPFDLIGDEVVTGVLSVGSTHTSERSKDIYEAKRSKPMSFEVAHVFTGLTPDELRERGVDIGCMAVVARSRKTPMYLGDRVCGYGLDDKGAVAASILAAKVLREAVADSGGIPPADVYLPVTTGEEVGCVGGRYIAHTLPVHTMIAVEVAPVAPEYPIEMSPAPVVNYKDRFVYHKGLSDRLSAIADDLGFGHQRCLFRTMGTDAGEAYGSGTVARAASVCFPTENTHGYEMSNLQSIINTGRMLGTYAANPKL